MKNKRILLMLLILFALFIIPNADVQATAKLCTEYSKDECPTRDGAGNECATKYDSSYGLSCAFASETHSSISADRTCREYSKDECPNVDVDGNVCAVQYDSSYGLSCGYASDDMQECYAFNSPRYYGANGMPDLSKCPTDRCTTSRIEGYCLPKKADNEPYTCEDYGYHTNVYGTVDLCSADGWGNPCATPEGGGACYTAEYIYTEENTNTCEDYLYDFMCYEHDDFGSECKWNSKTGKCETVVNQILINDFATGSTNMGIGYNSSDELLAAYTISRYEKMEVVHEPFKCSDVVYLTSAWTFMRIAAPFLIILLGSLDFIKAVTAGDEKKMKETRGKFIKRLIAFGLFILLPFVVQFIFSVMGTYGSENVCLIKCVVTNDMSDKGCD